MGAVRQPRQREHRKAKAIIITVVILVPVLCLAVVASIGAWQYNQTIAVSRVLQQINLAAAQYEIDSNGEPPPNIQALLDSGMLTELPVSPIDGRRMHVMQPGSTDFVGGVSYFLAEENNKDGVQWNEGILVCYHTAPSVFEVAWSWLAYPFLDRKSYEYKHHMKWSYSTKPDLVWDGGECGNNQEWVSRGLTPEQVGKRLQEDLDSFTEDFVPHGTYRVIDTEGMEQAELRFLPNTL